jgi:threonine synthase
VRPALPDWLADLPSRKERVTVLPADQMAVEAYVTKASRAAHQGATA